jgi:hypothetical protein
MYIDGWRRRRFEKGKGDNWLTRPLLRISRTGKVQVLPTDTLKPPPPKQ